MRRKLYDVESYPDFFCVSVMDFDTQEKKTWEISRRKNDLTQIVAWFSKFNGFLIGFNSIHYDNLTINYLIQNYNRLKDLTPLTITGELKKLSNSIIKEDHITGSIKKYKYGHPWKDVDVFLYWSKKLRQQKKISLKGLGIQLGYKVVQELPFDPDLPLQSDQKMEDLIYYNREHDLNILYKVITDSIHWQGKPSSFLQEIKLRHDIYKRYNLNAYSWDAPKIASELLLKFYESNFALRTLIRKKEIKISNNVDLALQDPDFSLDIFQNVFNAFQATMYGANDADIDLIYINNKTRIKISLGFGGIHSVNDNEIYRSNDKYQIVTSDVASLYPSLIENYKLLDPKLLNIYSNIKAERIIAKQTGDKSKDATYKLILNSTSGLLDQEYSWLFSHDAALKMRFMGQLILLKCIEEVSLREDFQVISANTDGIECIVPKDNLGDYYNIIDEVGRQFNVVFEHELYKSIFYAKVNKYLAVYDNGKTKKKGSEFITHPNLGDSCNYLVCSKALEEYFVNGTDIRKYLMKPDHHIFDFCLSFKVSKNYKVFYREQEQQRLNRFFVSNRGAYLYKRKEGKSTMENMLKGWGVTLLNEIDLDKTTAQYYNINYDYYIEKVQKKIDELERNRQLTLF